MPKTKKKQKVIQKEEGTGTLKNKLAKKKSVKKAPTKKTAPKKKSSKKTSSKKSAAKKKDVKAKTAAKENTDTLATSDVVIETDRMASIKQEKRDNDTEAAINESEVNVEGLSKNDGDEPATMEKVPPTVISDRRHAERRGFRSPLLYFSLFLLGSALFAGYWINEYGQNDDGKNIVLSDKLDSVVSKSHHSIREAVGVEKNGIETGLTKDLELLSVADSSEADTVAVLSGVVDTGDITSEPIRHSEDMPITGTPVTAEHLEEGSTEKIQLETPVFTQAEPLVEVDNKPGDSEKTTAVSDEVSSTEQATSSDFVNDNNAAPESLNDHYPHTYRPQSPYYYQGLVPGYRAPLPIDYYRQQSPPAMMPRVYPGYGYGYMPMPYPQYYGPHPYYPAYRHAPITQPGQQNSERQ